MTGNENIMTLNESTMDALQAISFTLKSVDKKLHSLVTSKQEVNSLVCINKTCNRSVTACLRIDILRLENINIQKQEFSTAFELHVRWKSGEITTNSEDDEWHPEIFFLNAVHLETVEKVHSKSPEDGMAKITYYVSGTFKCTFNLVDFPFDYQMLRISISSKWSRDVVLFRQDPDAQSSISSYSATNEDDQFEFEHIVLTGVSFSEREDFPNKNTFSTCTFETPIWRRQCLFLLCHIPPVFFVTLLSLVIFAVPASLPGHRILIAIALLFTAIAIRHIIHSTFLTKVHVITFFDKYWASCFLFVFLLAIESAIAALLNSPKIFDIVCFVLFLTLFIVFHLVFILLSIRKKRQVAIRINDIKEYYSTLARGTALPKETAEDTIEKEVKKQIEEVVQPMSACTVESEPQVNVSKKPRISRFAENDMPSKERFPPPLHAKLKLDTNETLLLFSSNEKSMTEEPKFGSSGLLIQDDAGVDIQPRLSSFSAPKSDNFDATEVPASNFDDITSSGKEVISADTEALTSTDIPTKIDDSFSPSYYQAVNPPSSRSRLGSKLSTSDDPAEKINLMNGSFDQPSFSSFMSQSQIDNLYQKPKEYFGVQNNANTVGTADIETAVPSLSGKADELPGNRLSGDEEDFKSPRLSAFYKYNEAQPEPPYVIPRYPSLALDDVSVGQQQTNPYDIIPIKKEHEYSYPPSPGGPPKLSSARDTTGIAKIEPIYVYSPGSKHSSDVFDIDSQGPLLPGGEPVYCTVADVQDNNKFQPEPSQLPAHDSRVPLISRVKDKTREMKEMVMTSSKTVTKSLTKNPIKANSGSYPASDGWL